MANDNQEMMGLPASARRRRLGGIGAVGGAINGVDDPTQSVYRQRPSADAAAVAELNSTLADVNNPSSPNSPLGARTAVQTPDITYDPQNRGLPFTTNNVDEAKRLAATRDAAISGQSSLPGAIGAPGTLTRAMATATPAGIAASPQSGAAARSLPGALPETWSSDAQNAFASNKPGTAVINGRVVSPSEIAALSNRNVIPSANFTNPGAGTNGYTPLPGQLTRPTNDVGFNMDTVAMANKQATSDVNSILSHDPRSPLGVTARNLSVDLSTSPSGGGRYGRGGQSAYEQAIGGLIGSVQYGNKGALETSLQDQRGGAQEYAADARSGATQYAVDARAGATQSAADTRAGATRYSADARGSAERDVANTRANTPKVNAAETKLFNTSYSHAYDALIKGGATPDDAATQAAQFGTNAVMGYRNLNAKPGAAAAKPSRTIPQGAIDMLRKNPDKAADFDQMFGAGASSQYLRG